MNLKALITTFVLGSSSVAMAHPVSAPVSATPAPIYQPTSQPIYRGPMPPQYAQGYEPTVYHPTAYEPYRHRAAWTTLGGVNQIADGAMALASTSSQTTRTCDMVSAGRLARSARRSRSAATGRRSSC